jgi:Protein of unknown function (DUF4019)
MSESGRGRVKGFLSLRFMASSLDLLIMVLVTSIFLAGCGLKSDRTRIPTEVEGLIATVGDDIANEQYDKIYRESSELWKRDSTPEQSAAVFKTLRSKLGKVESRVIHSATEQNNSGGPLKGRAFIITYHTKFERGEAMETFTLIEENGQWRLARYLVNSTELG